METFESQSELGNPIVDESDWASPTDQKPMKMEKQEKPAPPRPPPAPQGGSQRAFHVSPKMMLLKAQHALKARVANDTKKTKKKKDRGGANSSKRKRLAVKSDSDTTAESEAYEEKPSTKKEKGDGGKSVQPIAPKKKKIAKANVPPQPQVRHENEGLNQDQKKRRARRKQVTMAHRMQMGWPHPKRPHPPRRSDTVVFTRFPCYVACASTSFGEGRLSTRSLPTETPFPGGGSLLLACFLLTTQSVTLALVAVEGA